ncbi:MAG TPA: CDP-diacylglycerol--serine O-phosphatidyltransferase [Gammaproteobacteria bacterium]|nr:CDP-diacylglycerol--serine O-phosphatidyltransferase [Gammaproteobacteria bacterium]
MQKPLSPDPDVDTEVGVDEVEPGAPDTEGPRRRGIFLLPNLFTSAGLFSGFYAIVAAMVGKFEPAAIAVFVAMVFDSLDGRVARWTHTESAFGKEYDSLSDMVSFGLAPALVMYEWSLHSMTDYGVIPGKLGWMGAFIYAACAAIRLARFNVRAGVVDKRYFQGLPSPAAAGIVAGAVWCGLYFDIPGSALVIPAYIITVGAGVLMVSSVGYYSFKDLKLQGRVPLVVLLLVVLLIVVISLDPEIVLFLGFLIYAVSGLLMALSRFYRRRSRRAA